MATGAFLRNEPPDGAVGREHTPRHGLLQRRQLVGRPLIANEFGLQHAELAERVAQLRLGGDQLVPGAQELFVLVSARVRHGG